MMIFFISGLRRLKTMSSKHKRTKACAIGKKTKLEVYKRDNGCCIFCGAPGLPEAHIVPRSHGGLGVKENIVTACRQCHDSLDNSTDRKDMLQKAAGYLKGFYPEWKEELYIFEKWRKDKGGEVSELKRNSKQADSGGETEEKAQKDKVEPPDGFHFI